MEIPACLFCGSVNIKESFYPGVLFNGKVFLYHQCGQCQLNFNIPLLSGGDYEALYPVGYHDEFYFKETKRYDKQLRLLNKHQGVKTFLDYGCGDAGMLNFLQQNGYQCTGVEFNKGLVSILKEKYPLMSFYTVEEFDDQNQQYDCIHMGDVLEHMTDPNGIVQKLRGRINEGGYLFVEGPLEHNASLAYWFRKTFFLIRKKLQPKRQVEGRPYHTFLASRSNQLSMLRKNNLRTAYLSVYETAWPFPEKLKDCRGGKTFVEYIVGKLSIGMSFLFPFMGNRFYYFGEKKEK